MKRVHDIIRIGLVIGLLGGCNFSGLNTDIPDQVSALEGWNGIKLVTGQECGDCYHVRFPLTFGQTEDQLQLLIELGNQQQQLEYDMEGRFTLQEDILRHLKYMAVNQKSQQAALALLYPYDHGLEFEADTMDRLDVDYVIPMLEAYQDLGGLISSNIYPDLAQRLCVSMGRARDFRIFSLAAERLEMENPDLLNEIQARCDMEKLDLKRNNIEFHDAIW